jgi:lysophospholipase L1-like esterase
MTRTVLTFGDSNTHGSPPNVGDGAYARFGAGVRWPTVMQAQTGCNLIEEGLPGRTAGALTDPVMGPHMNGHLGLRIALQSHGPIDVLIIMLGTNDLKMHFGLTAAGITGGVAGLLAIATSDEYQIRHGGFTVLLVCPPPVLEQGPIRDQFWGAAEKSQALPPLYAGLAQQWQVGFLDAGAHIAPSPVDGVHFEQEAHVTLGKAIAARVAAA